MDGDMTLELSQQFDPSLMPRPSFSESGNLNDSSKHCEEPNLDTSEDEMVDCTNMIEEDELEKSETQDDIGSEFYLLPCCKEYKNPEKLFLHLKGHHDKDATKCVLCGKELSSKSSLDRHLLIHAKYKPYNCDHCDKPFSTNGNMHRHKKTHKGLCKGSKFMKEEHKLNKECSSTKKSKRNLSQSNDANIMPENTTALCNQNNDSRVINSEKRNMDETSRNEQPSKRLKPSCSENTSVTGNGITDIANKISSLDIKTYPPSPDSQPDVNQSVDDKTCLHTSSIISSSPSKEEFITTLGLKTACRFETKTESSGVSNDSYKSSMLHLQPHKDEHIVSESVDKERKQLLPKKIDRIHLRPYIKKETLKRSSHIRISHLDQPFKETRDVTNKDDVNSENVDSHFSNVDKHWLPESPETSSEGNLFESLLTPETSKGCEEDNLQSQYFCEHCKKEFKNKLIFQKHVVKHNKRKPFKCTICCAKLLSKQNATRHVIKVHKKKRLQAKLLIVENLDDPPNVETKILCEWCGQEFTSSLILEHHKRASTGCQAKPFICTICNKSFSTKNNGKRHQFKHHKEEQADCCIVRNVVPKTNEDTSSQLRIMDTSTSSVVTHVDSVDASPESSVESPSSSESDNPDEPERSVPKEELDAAQSLIDMSSSQIRRLSGDETIIYQPRVSPLPPPQSIMDFILHMPIPANLQNKPLDLSVHPMDLSSKSNERSDLLTNDELKRLPFFSSRIGDRRNEISRDRNSDTGVFPASNQSYSSSDSPLNLVKKKEPRFISHFISSLNSSLWFQPSTSFESNNHPSTSFESSNHPSTSFESSNYPSTSFESSNHPSTSFESSNHPSMEVDDTRQKECNSPKTSASYECKVCSMPFSTNSNKRRHEKAKHHMHCIVPQSLKLSFGFFNIKDKQITSTPKSGLSKKTKEALITKVSSVKPVEFEPVDFSTNSVKKMSEPLAIISSESENGDLASVSSLINTANSPQLKRYLTADNACDVTEAPEEGGEEQAQIQQKTVDQTLKSKKSSNKHWCAVCQKQFTCRSSFNRHSVIHTKKRDHHCQECKKTFTTKSNRDRHMKKVHRIMLSRDSKNPMSGKKQPKKPAALVPSESSEVEMEIKDLNLPKELVISEISQCNKENQRLYMPS